MVVFFFSKLGLVLCWCKMCAKVGVRNAQKLGHCKYSNDFTVYRKSALDLPHEWCMKELWRPDFDRFLCIRSCSCHHACRVS